MQFPGIEPRYLTVRKSFAGGRLQPRFDRRQPVREAGQDLRLRQVEGSHEGGHQESQQGILILNLTHHIVMLIVEALPSPVENDARERFL